MARAIWTGIVSFGLVSIPVRLVSAVKEKDVRFHQFHEKDGGRIRYQRVCEKEDKPVDYAEIERGYEVDKDRFVLISDEEIESLEPEKTRRIDIEHFVDLATIDPIYYDTTYYLTPDEGGEKPYRLLQAALESTGRAAVGRFVMREKEHLAVIRPLRNALALETLHYADEVVEADDLEDLPKNGKVAPRELQMAEQLVDSLLDEWRPERYKDDFRESVEKLARQKAKGKAVKLAEKPQEAPPVVDLMAALEASLKAARKEKSETPRSRKRKSA